MANKKFLGLIADVDPKEIAAHIEEGSLGMWCDRWRDEASSCFDEADRAEVVHGRWINKTKVIYGQEDVCYQCSHCETAYYYDAPERYNYCPNCGAKMDGDGNV